MHRTSALWRVKLTVALNRSLLNSEKTLINAGKVLTSIVPVRMLHAFFLSNITPRYFTWLTKGIFLPFNVGEALFIIHYSFLNITEWPEI